jgi:integrase
MSGGRIMIPSVIRSPELEQTNLVLRLRAGAGGRVYWDAQWRYRTGHGQPWQLKKQRLGLAWQEQSEGGGWRRRRGRCPEGRLDERAAHLAAVAAMEEHRRLQQRTAEEQTKAAAAEKTVRALAHVWLGWLKEVWGAKPSTVKDYGFLMREPGIPYKRGHKVSAGRIMQTLGDRPAAEVTTLEVSRFLRALDREGLTARNVNKHREVLSAIFAYGCRADTLCLPANPVDGTDKRRQAPPAALDYYEVDEVEALASACERGEQRTTRTVCDEAELAARAAEDRQDAEAFRLLFYTGLRLGELLALRWSDVDLEGRLLLVQRGLSAGEERLPKGGRPRFVPLPTPACEALQRLRHRDDFVTENDYVIVSRIGRRLDPSALRRRYKRGCAAASLRPVRLHGLRHAAGSLVARTSDPVFVRDFLGHAKLSTTDRYVSAKARPEELERLDRAFARSPSTGSD